MAAGAAPYRKLDPALRAERAAIVFDLRLQGLSYRQIDILTQAPDGPTGGHRISATTAKELLYEEAARRVDPKVDAWRALQLDRLDGVLRDHLALRNANWDRAMDGEERPALAVDRALNGVTKTVEAQNKLLGLATTKIEAQVVEVTQQDVELQEMIRTAKAKAALEEAAIIDGEAGE
ncbi:hypothetical protein G3I39_25065 [Streptomyces fulvissimus]|uniref:Terminase small subunit n=1 Tax=Streptomyces microflavus TaxID=1919 RepID=A0A6N9VBR8_STRMI|nr:hypothetical protein [Streptomyces microflavus]NEB70300.1 hypothetical protein [Streptomyces microflavus]NEE45579.1 hypothetical protein [Streptomyces sp. SID8455]